MICLKTTLVSLTLIIMTVNTIEIPIRGLPQCMILQQAQDVISQIKVEVKFPKIANKSPGQNFNVNIYELLSKELISQSKAQEDSVFRSNFNLQPQKLYTICFQFNGKRKQYKENEQIWIQYNAKEDFDTMIGQIEIPKQLQGEQNLKKIFEMSESASKLNQRIRSNQAQQRKVQEDLTNLNLHKNQRIVSLTLIECLVIALSGVYQIFALRKFLIQKGLY